MSGPGARPPEAAAAGAARLTQLLAPDDVAPVLWRALDDGELGELVPEFPLLALEQDPVHKHKDVLAHTIAVVANTPSRTRLRLAALFHDIAKPQTRSFEHGTVTFRNHEQVGAKVTRARLRALGYPDELVREVSQLVYLSGRFKGYSPQWTDAAVRRYARDAGGLLVDLNDLVRCDCTTRNPRRFAQLQRNVDHLEARIADLAAEDRRRAERPDLDGTRIMELFGLEPGPLVGAARRHLLELRRERGHALDEGEAIEALRSFLDAQTS